MKNSDNNFFNDETIKQAKDFFAASLRTLDESKCYKYNSKNQVRKKFGFDFVDVTCTKEVIEKDDVILNVPGVYFIFNENNKLIYIGESGELRDRLRTHYDVMSSFGTT